MPIKPKYKFRKVLVQQQQKKWIDEMDIYSHPWNRYIKSNFVNSLVSEEACNSPEARLRGTFGGGYQGVPKSFAKSPAEGAQEGPNSTKLAKFPTYVHQQRRVYPPHWAFQPLFPPPFSLTDPYCFIFFLLVLSFWESPIFRLKDFFLIYFLFTD